MPVWTTQTNFTSGEWSDKLIGQVSLDKMKNAARCLKNFVVLVHGGAARRAGSLYLGNAKFADRLVRLHQFEFSITQAYMLEIGHEYIRFWDNRARLELAGVPVEVETPYQEEDLRELRFTQTADVMYVLHPNYAPRKLIRVTSTSFTFLLVNWTPPPSFEQEILPDATLTLTAVTGIGIHAVASAAVFLDGDQGRTIESGAGRAMITGFTSTSEVILDIIDDFDSTLLASGEWELHGSPNFGTITASQGSIIRGSTTLTSTLPAFRSTDVGAFILFNDATMKIYSVTSTTVVLATLLSPITNLGSGATAGPGLWTLERASWSDDVGWPGAITLHGQRLWIGGSHRFPDTVWASVTGDYENFARGPDDDDGLDFTLAEPGVNLIRWMLSGSGSNDSLKIGTLAGEFTIEGGTDAPITPTNVRVKTQGNLGSDYTVDALPVDGLALFVQRGATRMREMVFNFQKDKYVAPDLTLLAEHLTRVGIVETAYARVPDSLVFAVRSDGVLLTMAYNRDEDVVGWSHHETCGLYESVAVRPNACGTGDEIWTAVNRPIATGSYFDPAFFDRAYFDGAYWGGALTADVRYIEVFDGALNTDAALTYSGTAVGSLTGAGHLEGLTAQVITSCTWYDITIDGGEAVLPTGITTTGAEVGLRYTSTLETMRPEMMGQSGTMQGKRKRWTRVAWRFFCTQGNPQFNGEPLRFPDEGRTLTDPYTGDAEPNSLPRWDPKGQFVLQQVDPKPCTVLSFAGGITAEDG